MHRILEPQHKFQPLIGNVISAQLLHAIDDPAIGIDILVEHGADKSGKTLDGLLHPEIAICPQETLRNQPAVFSGHLHIPDRCPKVRGFIVPLYIRFLKNAPPVRVSPLPGLLDDMLVTAEFLLQLLLNRHAGSSQRRSTSKPCADDSAATRGQPRLCAGKAIRSSATHRGSRYPPDRSACSIQWHVRGRPAIRTRCPAHSRHLS